MVFFFIFLENKIQQFMQIVFDGDNIMNQILFSGK